MKVNSQYMHVLWFNIKVKEPITLSSVKEKLHNNDHVAITNKDLTSTVFSFGRDHGHYGRIMNQTVVVEQSLHVRNEHEISGFVSRLKMVILYLVLYLQQSGSVSLYMKIKFNVYQSCFLILYNIKIMNGIVTLD